MVTKTCPADSCTEHKAVVVLAEQAQESAEKALKIAGENRELIHTLDTAMHDMDKGIAQMIFQARADAREGYHELDKKILRIAALTGAIVGVVSKLIDAIPFGDFIEKVIKML